MARIRVEGLRELDRALTELPRATARNVLKRAGIRALTPVAEEAARLAPELFGDLKDSVAASDRRPRRHRKSSDVEVFAGPGPNPQAHLQEFGTQHHGAQPFMRPAWDMKKREALDSVKDDLADEIGLAAARIARKNARRIRQAGG